MKRFEYEYISIPMFELRKVDTEKAVDRMKRNADSMGDQGWEAFASCEIGDFWVMSFKREMPEPAEMAARGKDE